MLLVDLVSSVGPKSQQCDPARLLPASVGVVGVMSSGLVMESTTRMHFAMRDRAAERGGYGLPIKLDSVDPPVCFMSAFTHISAFRHIRYSPPYFHLGSISSTFARAVMNQGSQHTRSQLDHSN